MKKGKRAKSGRDKLERMSKKEEKKEKGRDLLNECRNEVALRHSKYLSKHAILDTDWGQGRPREKVSH